MQYIVTFLWSFLLITMLNYVVSSVLGVDFVFATGVIISVVFSIVIILISAVLPSQPDHAENH